MKRLFGKDFWNTPIRELGSSDKRLAMLFFLTIILICTAIAGIAAAHLIKP